MGILGALFGGALGLAFGGPLGAVLGGALGASVGTLQGEVRRAGAGSAAEVQAAFMVALISLAAKTAKADGRVTREEVDTLDRFLRAQGMRVEDRRRAAEIFNRARDSGIEAKHFARQIRFIAGGRRELLRDLITMLLQIAHADGRLHAAEEELVAGIAREMGLSPEDHATCRARFTAAGRPPAGTDRPDPYRILGLSPEAGPEEVKAAYRRLAKEYHPDRIQAKGLPEDFLTFAKEKFQAINEAYHRIKEERGFR